MSDRRNILLLSAGRRVALVHILRRTLTDLGIDGEVIAADITRLAAAVHAADSHVLVPPCSDPSYVDVLLRICEERGVLAVVPTTDRELAPLAHMREQFEAVGTAVAISSPRVVEIAADKASTYRWLVEAGFPTITQAPADQVSADPSGWTFPLMAKPRFGSASIGVIRVDSALELRAATTGNVEYIVQTVAPGIEYTIDILADRTGGCVCAVPRRRLEVRAGESSKGVTVRFPELEELAAKVCEALPGAYGPLTVQVMFDEASGSTNVIEINPRFGGGYPLAWQAGAAYPRWLLEEALGKPVTAAPSAWRDGLVMLRYDEALFVDAREVDL